MARYARRDYPITGERVDAHLEPANEKHNYFCACKGCKAPMYPYALGNENARFVSYNKNDHISIECISNELMYNPHVHAEALFNMEEFEEYLYYESGQVQTTGNSTPNSIPVEINNDMLTPIRTTNDLYLQFCRTGLGNCYNGYLIDDYFACRDNYDVKSEGLEGFQLVETSFYYYKSYTQYMFFNYPPFTPGKKQNVYVRLDFGSKDKAYEFYKRHFMDKVSGKRKDGIHSKLIVVAGRWEKSDNDEAIASCIINKISQIKFYN